MLNVLTMPYSRLFTWRSAARLQRPVPPLNCGLMRRSTGQPSSKVFAMLPRAAELCRRQVASGSHGNPDAATKARIFLREWFGGRISLEPLADGGLMAR